LHGTDVAKHWDNSSPAHDPFIIHNGHIYLKIENISGTALIRVQEVANKYWQLHTIRDKHNK